MKTVIGIIVCLILTGVILCIVGCGEVYLPPDMQTALDLRIVELQRAQQLYPSAECSKVIASDLEFLTTLKEAVK